MEYDGNMICFMIFVYELMMLELWRLIYAFLNFDVEPSKFFWIEAIHVRS